MAAGSIIIDLLMKTGSFETDTKRAEKALAEFTKTAVNMGAVVGAAIATAGAAATAMVVKAIDDMDEMGKAAQKAGTSVETFSAMAYAADLAGVSQEALGSAMAKLSKNISDAARGTGDAAKAFDAMGISAKNADGSLKGADQILMEMAGRFATYEDGPEKTALAIAALGRAGADLIPYLNQGQDGIEALMAEARALGVVLDTETTKAAEDFNDNLSRLSYSVKGVSNVATAELLPVLGEVAKQLVEVAKDEKSVEVASDLVKAAFGGLLTIFQTVAVVGSDVAFVFQGVGREIGAWLAQLDALDRFDLAGFHAISDAVKADGERARRELDKFQARIMDLGKTRAPTFNDPRLLGNVPSMAEQVAALAGPKRRAPQIASDEDDKKAKEAASNAKREAEKRKREAEKDKWDLIKMQREAAASAGDAWIAESIEHNKKAEKAADDYRRAIESLTSDTQIGRTERLRQELQLLQDALTKGDIDPEMFKQAWDARLAAMATPIRDVNTELTATQQLLEQMGETSLDALGAIATGGVKAGDALKALLGDVARLIYQLGVVEPLMEMIRGQIGTGRKSGPPSNPFAGLFSFGGTPINPGVPANPFAAGSGGFLGSLGSLFGGFLAEGGGVNPGKAYVVGDRGEPEWFIPRTAGVVIPESAMSGERAGNLHIINQTTGRVDRAHDQKLNGRDRAIILQENRAAFLRDISNPNSELSMAFAQSFNVRRSRS
jgi:hypothetical protein